MQVLKLIAFFGACFTLLCHTGCSSSIRTDVKIIRIDDEQVASIDLSSIFKITKTIQFDTSVFLIDHINKVKVNSNNVYIWDRSGLHRFSMEGDYICTIGRKGRSYNEYYAIGDFDVQDTLVTILDFNKKILFYNREGAHLKTYDVPFFASTCKLSHEEALLAISYQDSTAKFHRFDITHFNELAQFGEIQSNELTYRHFMKQKNYFVDRSGRLLFFEPMNNEVLAVDMEKATPTCRFDFYSKNPPDKFLRSRFSSVADAITKANDNHYCYGISDYFEDAGKYLVVYNDSGDTYCAYCDTIERISFRSQHFSYPGVFDAISVNDISLNFNSLEDLSIMVPYINKSDTRACYSDNPVLLLLSVK